MDLQKNADRFKGFADVYDSARPQSPAATREILRTYLERQPECVVDLGCGTGLSTLVWSGECCQVIGVEPGDGMREIARKKAEGLPNVSFLAAFAHQTGLADACADIVTCSQSFHWMEPISTLKEIGRILKPGGVFAAYDYDWPPAGNWRIEEAYEALFTVVNERDDKKSIERWDKNSHLANIRTCGEFRYAREALFSSELTFDADRYIQSAVSQGGLQALLRKNDSQVAPLYERFCRVVKEELGEGKQEMLLFYRMRLGVK